MSRMKGLLVAGLVIGSIACNRPPPAPLVVAPPIPKVEIVSAAQVLRDTQAHIENDMADFARRAGPDFKGPHDFQVESISLDKYEKDTAIAVVRYKFFLPYCYQWSTYKNAGQFWRLEGFAGDKCYEEPLVARK